MLTLPDQNVWKSGRKRKKREGGPLLVTKRPGLDAFLATLAEHFEVVVFTAGTRAYAKPILDRIDPTGEIYGDNRLYRDSCTSRKGPGRRKDFYTKNLKLLGRDLSRTVLIDNTSACFLCQPDNGIPIASFFALPSQLRTDVEFDRVLADLAELSNVPARQDSAEDFSRLDALLLSQLWPGFSFPRIALHFHDRM